MKVGRSDEGWEIAVCDMDLTQQGRELFGLDKIVCFIWDRFHDQWRILIGRSYSASNKCIAISFLNTPPT